MVWSNLVKKFANSTKTISGTKYPTKMGDIDHHELKFYAENPRIYTKIMAHKSAPSQTEIETLLSKQPHVKKLVKEIVQHGGNIEPIVVRDDTFEVLEGNSRLAAYRKLKGDKKFQQIKCEILPHDISEDHILAFLGQIHITGKTPWAKHEQARYLLRMTENEKGEKIRDIADVAKPIGISVNEANRQIKTVKLMENHQDSKNDHFSYYFTLFSNRETKRAMENVPGFEDRIIEEISEGNFDRALDFRDALSPVCQDNRLFKKFLNGDIDLSEAKRRVESKDAKTSTHSKVRKALDSIKSVDSDDIETLTISQVGALLQDLRKLERKVKGIIQVADELKRLSKI